MKFRKLLAFVLVFSMATQPGGVRFGYAEDTKAAEVENKAEESDEIGIDLDEAELDEYLFDPGSREQNSEDAVNVEAKEATKTSKVCAAVVGKIAAGVAAVPAVVGTLGLMIYNGVSNKDEIEKLWTSEEDSFFSRLGKTVSILLKGGNNCRYGENEAGDECLSGIDPMCKYGEDKKNHRCLAAELADEDVTPVDEEELCEYGEDEKNHCCLATKPANEIASLEDYQQKEAERLVKEEALLLENNKTVLRNGVNNLQSRVDALNEEHKGDLQDELNAVKNTIENATTVEALEGVEGQLTTLEGKVAEAEAAQKKAEDEARKLEELNGKKTKLNGEVTSVQSRVDALKEEHKGSLQDELNTVKNTIENATTVEALEGVEGQLTTLEGKVAKAEAAQQEAEKHKKKEQELDAAKQAGETRLNELKDAIANADGKGGEALTKAEELKTELTNALNGADAKAITDAANKVDGVVKALNDAVAAEKKAEEEERVKKEAEDEAHKLEELNGRKTKLNGEVTSVQSRIDALKEEHKGILQDELDTVKATIENATSVEALEGVDVQLTTFEGKVTEAEAAQRRDEESGNDNKDGTVEQPSEKQVEPTENVEEGQSEENEQEKDQPNEDSEQSTVFTGNSDDVKVEKQEENTNEVLSTDPTKISDSNVNEDDVKVGGDVQQQVGEEQKIEQEESDLNKEETKPTGIISRDKFLCDEGKLAKDYCEQLKEKLNVKQPSEEQVEPSEVKNDQNIENQQEGQENEGVAQQQVGEEQKIEQEESDLNKEETKPTGIISRDKFLCDEGKLAKEYCDNLEEKIKVEQPSEEKTEQINEVENELNEENEQEDQSNDGTEQPTGFADSSGDVKVGGDVQQQVGEEQKSEQEESDSNKEEPAPQEIPESTPGLSNDNKDGTVKQPSEETVEPSEEEKSGKDVDQPTDSNVNEDNVKDEVDGQLNEPEQQPKTDVTSQQNNEDNSRSENSTVVVTSESKEAFIGPATKNVFELNQRKNKIQNTLNKLNKTCGLDVADLQEKLNAIDLVEAEANAKLDEAEKQLNSISDRLNALRGKCATLGSDKDYIVANWETVVSILDSSDASLRNDFDTLKLQRVTEGNLETLAEDYKEIAGRVKAVIDNSNEISKLTGNISTFIEDNQNAQRFDTTFYKKWKKQIENVPKTEESLPEIKNKLDKLWKEINAKDSSKDIKALNTFNSSATIKYFESKECSADDKYDLYASYEPLFEPIITNKNKILADANKNHSFVGVAENLKDNIEVVNRVDKVVANVQMGNKIIDQNEDLLDKSYWRSFLKEATKSEVVAEDSLDLHEANVEVVLSALQSIVSEANEWRNKINNGVIMQGNCDPIMAFWDILDTISDEGCAKLRGEVAKAKKRLDEKVAVDHDVAAYIKGLEDLHKKSHGYIGEATKLEFDANAAEEIINEAGKFGLIDAEYFNSKLEENKDYSLENLQTKRTDMKAFLNELQNNYSKKEIKAVNKALEEFDNSKLVRGFYLGECSANANDENAYENYDSNIDSLIKEKDAILAKAREAKTLENVEPELKKVLAKIEDIRQVEDKRRSGNEKITQLGNNKFFPKDHYNGRLEGILTCPLNEKEVAELNDRLAGLLSHLEDNFSKKNLNKLSSLDKDIRENITQFGEYKASYVKSEQKKYDEKIEELKNMHDAGKAVAEMENYKKELQIKLDKLKKFCKNNPSKCGK